MRNPLKSRAEVEAERAASSSRDLGSQLEATAVASSAPFDHREPGCDSFAPLADPSKVCKPHNPNWQRLPQDCDLVPLYPLVNSLKSVGGEDVVKPISVPAPRRPGASRTRGPTRHHGETLSDRFLQLAKIGEGYFQHHAVHEPLLQAEYAIGSSNYGSQARSYAFLR